MLELVGSESCPVLVAWRDWDRARGTEEIPLPHTALGLQVCPQSPRLRKHLGNYLLWLPSAPGMGEGLSLEGCIGPLMLRHVSPAHPPSGTPPSMVGAEKGPRLETSQEQAGMFAGHTHRGFRTSTNQCYTYRRFSEGFGSTFSQSWAVWGFLTCHLEATARSTDGSFPSTHRLR